LKILLRPSGIQPGIDNRGTRNPSATTASATLSTPSNNSALNSSSNQTVDRKGKGRAVATEQPFDPSDDIDLDLKTIQVLDILPDLSPTYVRLLLNHDQYGRDTEKVVAALLEGTALSEEDLDSEKGKEYTSEDAIDSQEREQYSLNQRRNVFDEEVLDVNLFRTGKKTTGLVSYFIDNAVV
jgi:activating signal cointegrator complex subunit 2